MFFNVTRYGATTTLRLGARAIGYLAETPDGCAIHVIGGEVVRVNETWEEVEARALAALKSPAPRQGVKVAGLSDTPKISKGL